MWFVSCSSDDGRVDMISWFISLFTQPTLNIAEHQIVIFNNGHFVYNQGMWRKDTMNRSVWFFYVLFVCSMYVFFCCIT